MRKFIVHIAICIVSWLGGIYPVGSQYFLLAMYSGVNMIPIKKVRKLEFEKPDVPEETPEQKLKRWASTPSTRYELVR